MSPEFADEAARTLAANGIKAFIFESLRPTPELSFAVRHLDCIFIEIRIRKPFLISFFVVHKLLLL